MPGSGRFATIIMTAACAVAIALPLHAADELRERYLQILLERPERGIAFERLYQSYADRDGVDVLLGLLQRAAEDQPRESVWWLIAGFVHERAGDDDAALAAYTSASEREPNNYRAFAARGMLLWHRRQLAPAADAIRQAVALEPDRETARRLWITLGRVYATAGDGERAIDAWMQLGERFGDDPAVREELADLLVEHGRIDDAVAQYDNLRQTARDADTRVRATFAIADLYLVQQKPDQAVALLREQLAQLAPDSWLRGEAQRRIENALRQQGKADALNDFYIAWLDEHPDDIAMRLVHAQELSRRGQVADAETALIAIIEQAASRHDARAMLARLYIEQGRYRDATDVCQALCERDPLDAGAWERLGQIHLGDLSRPQADRQRDAEAAWRHVASEKPDDPTRAVRAAELFRLAAMSDAAIEHYQQAIALEPASPQYHEYLARYLHELGRKDQAIAAARQMVQVDRAPADHRVRLIEVLMSFGYFDAALEDIDRVADDEPRYELLSMRVAALMHLDRFADAARTLDALQPLAGTFDRQRAIRLSRVELARRQGMIDQRIAELSDVTTADALELVALLHAAASRHEDAAAAMRLAVERDANTPGRIALAVDMYEQAGDERAAIDALRRLIELEPDNEATHAGRIAEIARRAEDFDTAQQAASRLIELTPDSAYGYLLAADLHRRAGRDDDAADTLRQGVRRSPRDPQLLAALAARLTASGQTTEAIDLTWRAYDAADDDDGKLRAADALARLYIDTGRFERFIDMLRDRQSDPRRQRIAMLATAAAYRRADQPDRAMATLHRTMTLFGQDQPLLDQLMNLAGDLGQTEQAIAYGEQLAALRPDDVSIRRRLGTLLYDSGRVDEAIEQWRTGQNDSADDALRLAETLADHGLRDQTIEVLAQAAHRFGDDWRVAYALGVQLKTAGQYNRARQTFDDLIARTEPADARPATPVERWWTLLRVRDSINHQIQQANQPAARQPFGGPLRLVVAPMTGMGSGAPTTFRTTRTAALVHRLHMAETNGDMSAYLAQRANAAGYACREHDALVAAQKSSVPAAHATDDDRERWLEALLLVGASREACAALADFRAIAPDDVGLLALDAMLHAAALTGVQRELNVPAATTSIEQLAARDSAAATAIVPAFIDRLVNEGHPQDAARWVQWLIAHTSDTDAIAGALGILARTDETQLVIDQTTRLLGLMQEQMHTTPNIKPMQRLIVIAETARLGAQGDVAVEWFGAHLRMAAQLAGSPTAGPTPPTFVLGGRGVADFPNPCRMFSPAELDLLRRWHTLLTRLHRTDQAIATLGERDGDRAAFEAAAFLWLSGRPDDAEAALRRAIERSDSDELRIVLAQLLLTRDRPADAFDQLAQVRGETGPAADEARAGMIILAVQAGRIAQARPVAARLAQSPLNRAEAQALLPYLTALGMQSDAERLSRAVAPQAAPSQPQLRLPTQPDLRRITLLQRLVDDKQFDSATALAMRMVREQARGPIGQPGDPQVVIAARALRDAGTLDDVLGDLESRFAADPADTDVMRELWLLYSAANKPQQAAQTLERYLTMSPNELAVRLQYADALAKRGDYPAAAPHYERILRENPALIHDNGSMVAYAFREAGRIDTLVELIEQIEFNHTPLTVTPNRSAYAWIWRVANHLEHQDAAAALRVYLHVQKIEPAAGPSTHFDTRIFRIAAQQPNPDVLLDQLRRTAGDRVDVALAGALFMSQRDRSSIDGQPHAIMRQIIELFDPPQPLIALINEQSDNNAWYRLIGLPLRAMIDLAKGNASSPHMGELIAVLEQRGAFPASDDRWRFAVASCVAAMAAERDDRLAIAARFADIALGTPAQESFNFHTIIAMHAVIARAAAAQNDEPAVQQSLVHMMTHEHPRSASRGINASASIDFDRFACAIEFIDLFIKHHRADLIAELIAVTRESLTGNQQQAYVDDFNRAIKQLDREGRLAPVLDYLESQRAAEPDNQATLQQLMHLYQLTGRLDRAAQLAARLGDDTFSSPQLRYELAIQLAAGDDKARARRIFLDLIRDGHDFALRDADALADAFDTEQACVELVEAFEKMPHNQQVASNSMYWVMKLAYPVRQLASGKRAKADRQRLNALDMRIAMVADRLSAPAQAPADGQNRPYLWYVVRQYRQYDQMRLAYDYLHDSIFEAQRIGAPPPTVAQLFHATSTSAVPSQCLATLLVEMAGELNELDNLTQTIVRRREADATWTPIAMRLETLIAFEQGDSARARALLDQIDPPHDPAATDRNDPSLPYLVERVGQAPQEQPAHE